MTGMEHEFPELSDRYAAAISGCAVFGYRQIVDVYVCRCADVNGRAGEWVLRIWNRGVAGEFSICDPGNDRSIQILISVIKIEC